MILYGNLRLLNSYTFLYPSHQWSLVKFKFLPIFHSLIPVYYYIISASPLFTSLSIPDPSLRTLCNAYSSLKKSSAILTFSKPLFSGLRLFENSPPQRAQFSLGPLRIQVPSFFPSINIYWSATDHQSVHFPK